MTPWDAVVRDVLDQARRAAGGGAALAAALKAAGVGPDSGTYSESAVSNWIKGRTRPPADVVLGAAALHGLSLDKALDLSVGTGGRIHEGSATATLAELQSAVARLEEQFIAGAATRSELVDPDAVKDLRAVYATRSEALAAMPPLRTLAGAGRFDVMGISLNAVWQAVSDITLAELIENGLTLRCLFLDPAGMATAVREAEEGLPKGHLAELTKTNLHALARVRSRLAPESQTRLQARTYDDPVRFNLTIIDGDRSLLHLYLPRARGVDSPTLLIEHDDSHPHGLFPIFESIFSNTWERAHVVST